MTQENRNTIIIRMMTTLGINKQKDLAKILDVHESGISPYKKRENVPDEWIRTLQIKMGINPEWLRTGQGEMRWRQQQEPEPPRPAGGLVQIPLVTGNVRDKSGYHLLSIESNMMWFSAEKLLDKGIKPEKLLMIAFKGQHMSPEVQNGDMVIFNTEDTAPAAYTLAVVRIEDSMSVYRLVLTPGEVHFTSTDTKFAPIAVKRKLLGSPQVEILGRAVGVIRQIIGNIKGVLS